MKRKLITVVFFFVLAAVPAVTPASAQSGGPFKLAWDAVVSGGGTSTGGAFTLTDSVGQPAAGASRGGPYTMLDGFGSQSGDVPAPASSKTYLPLLFRP